MKLNFPILFASDTHTHTNKLDEICARHPEITNRVFLGDLFSFNNNEINKNKETGEWLKNNIKEWIFVRGNHDRFICQNFLVDFEVACLVKENFKLSARIDLENDKYILAYHSLPNNDLDFVEEYFTEREFLDSYPIDDAILGILIGHNHKCFKKIFQSTDTELWSIGSVRDGYYAILTEKGIENKKI